VVIKRESETLAVDDAAPEFDDVYFIVGDPCNDRVLRRANVQEADTALIIADRSHLQYADAQSILIALAIEAMNSAVHTCVEVVNSDNLKHFAHTKVDECVSMEHLGELLISQAALNHGISSFYTELLTYQENGNEVYHVPMPGAFVGKTFGDLARRVLTENMIAAGLVQNGISRANPPRDTVLAADDKVIIISGVYPEIDGLAPERAGAAGGA
jgi:voltage-gated potassium channel